MDQVGKEYGDEQLDGLVPPSQSSLEVGEGDDSSFAPSYSPVKPKKSLLFYLATVQAFIIIYQTEVMLGSVLAISLGIAISSSYHGGHRKKVNPFEAAHISHDYTAVTSKYDLTLGSIDHWCLRGDDNNCRCEDPLEPMSKRSSHKWDDQHKENIKVAQAALMKLLANNADKAWNNYDGYQQDFDDMWIEGSEDDWIYGEGGRFTADDYGGFDPLAVGGWDEDMDDGFGVPVEKPADDQGRQLDEYEGLDVVFLGDSITEQRQGTSMNKPEISYTGIKEVFDKTFTKEKGGDFNGIAMGISGDTVCVYFLCMCVTFCLIFIPHILHHKLC